MIFNPSNNDLGRAGVVYREIKRRITELVYKPGDKISEARIAEELGCGRSPVRTAFSRLQSEGWTEISPSSGTFVRGLSATEITEILEARILLESYLAGRAARMMSDGELVRLRNAFSSFGERVAADHLDEYLELDLQFHLAVYKAAANKVLSDVLLNLIDKVQWIRRASAGYPSRIREAFSEIHAVLDALEARDEEAASAAMRIHIENTLEFRRPDPSRHADETVSTQL
ncbi:DNA-binding GntR family transcriptional regulator [Nitrobacteraceae bacterium AZCC 2161]|jgi:DNA-binding GntR family transcriptional regulator